MNSPSSSSKKLHKRKAHLETWSIVTSISVLKQQVDWPQMIEGCSSGRWVSVPHGCENKEAASENLNHGVFILQSIL